MADVGRSALFRGVQGMADKRPLWLIRNQQVTRSSRVAGSKNPSKSPSRCPRRARPDRHDTLTDTHREFVSCCAHRNGTPTTRRLRERLATVRQSPRYIFCSVHLRFWSGMGGSDAGSVPAGVASGRRRNPFVLAVRASGGHRGNNLLHVRSGRVTDNGEELDKWGEVA